MPQQLQQSALPPTSHMALPVAAPPSATDNTASAKKAFAPEEEYIKWYRMKRAGFWRWFLLHSFGECVGFAVGGTWMPAMMLNKMLGVESHSNLDKIMAIANIQGLLLCLFWFFMAIFIWFRTKRRDARRRAALAKLPAP